MGEKRYAPRVDESHLHVLFIAGAELDYKVVTVARWDVYCVELCALFGMRRQRVAIILWHYNTNYDASYPTLLSLLQVQHTHMSANIIWASF